MTDMLSKLYAAKAVVRAADEAREPLEELRERAEGRRSARRGFRAALAAATGPAIVAEIKGREVRGLVKGSLYPDDLMRAVAAPEGGLRGERRLVQVPAREARASDEQLTDAPDRQRP